MTTETSMRMTVLPGPGETERMNSAELREHFLAARLFEPGAMNLVYTELDRLIVGGIAPHSAICLPAFRELGTGYFTDRREVGILNIGGAGTVTVDGTCYDLDRLDGLYIGMGSRDIRFAPANGGEPLFYLASSPAHKALPTVKVARSDARPAPIGDDFHASRRSIRKYIAPGLVETCQLVMGVTELEPNSIWNTMPAHTHGRRSEIYLYFDLGSELVFHLMGRAGNTRHIVVRDREAVLSPPWSIHAGAGTAHYRFAWAMAGENQDFGDIDCTAPSELL